MGIQLQVSEYKKFKSDTFKKGHEIWSASRRVIEIIKFLNILPSFAQ